MSADEKILKEFQEESRQFITEMQVVLDNIDGDFSKVKELENYGQIVDRIMGAAKSLGMLMTSKNEIIDKLGDYTALCKVVGYKAAENTTDEAFFNLCVAVLQDATEALGEMVEIMLKDSVELKDVVSQTLIDRVKWLSDQFEKRKPPEDDEAGKQKMKQSEIDELVKKLGL